MPACIYLNLDQSRRQTAGFIDNFVTSATKNILVIIHDNGNHWILGALNWSCKTIGIFDSLRKPNHSVHFAKLYAIADLALTSLGKQCKFDEFSFYLAHDNPKQVNNDDCALFAARTIKNIFTRTARNFEIRTGEYRRDLVEVLENEIQIREPVASNSRSSSYMRLTSTEFRNAFDSLRITPNFIDFSELIKFFF